MHHLHAITTHVKGVPQIVEYNFWFYPIPPEIDASPSETLWVSSHLVFGLIEVDDSVVVADSISIERLPWPVAAEGAPTHMIFLILRLWWQGAIVGDYLLAYGCDWFDG